AVAAVSFTRELPDDARLLLTIRPDDLLDEEPDAAFRETLAAMNAPLTERIAVLARQLYGNTKARSVDAVARAVADLPYAVVRRHAHDDPMPPWLENDVAASVLAVLRSFGEGP
ncbi:TetR family transcriptional regulator, partial [Mycobacterium nebraskense]